MRYGLTLQTAPTVEPISIREARKQVELPESYARHDELLGRLVTAARRRAEAITGRQICTATWDLHLDQWPDDLEIYLPKPPLQSVTSITYVDGDGATQTWSSSNYVVSTSREPGLVRLAYNGTIPTTRYQPDAIRVRYVAGYTAIPDDLKAAMLLMVGHWFEHREDAADRSVTEIPYGSTSLLQSYIAGDEFVDYSGACE
jgi:phage conserved hypothetical protein, phiE125 gp8 family